MSKPKELESVNRLYLELSQFVTAKTAREMQLEDLLSSAFAIASRGGADTGWERFRNSLIVAGISPYTAKTYKADKLDPEWVDKP